MILKNKIPERSCLYCRWSKIRTGQIECKCDSSLYFEQRRHKRECCPDFAKDK